MARFLSLGAAAGLPLFLLAITMMQLMQQAGAFLAPAARTPSASAQGLRSKVRREGKAAAGLSVTMLCGVGAGRPPPR